MAFSAVSAALAALLAAAGSDASPAVRTSEPARGFLTFTEAGPQLPPDKIFVPTRLEGRVPLVVVLHGCQQDADAIAAAAKWNELAEKESFLILYPNQQWGRNPFNCWNWFAPFNQTAGIGEPAEILAAVEVAKRFYPVDADRVYVAGISAGGATVATLLSCSPGEFAAGAVHSGVPYGLAATPADGLDLMKNGPNGRTRAGWCDPATYRGGVFIIHGSSDTVINPANAERLAADFSGADVRKVIVPGLGHAWSPDATGLMWSFFQARRKP